MSDQTRPVQVYPTPGGPSGMIFVPTGYEVPPGYHRVDQNPVPPPTGWAGVVHVLKGLRHDQIVTWALIGTLGVFLWQGPKVLSEINNNNLRVQQEEGERTRQAISDRDQRTNELNTQRDLRFLDTYKVESERNRQASESQIKLLFAGTQQLSKEIGRLDATNQRLEGELTKLREAVMALTKKMGDCQPVNPARPDRVEVPPYIPPIGPDS